MKQTRKNESVPRGGVVKSKFRSKYMYICSIVYTDQREKHVQKKESHLHWNTDVRFKEIRRMEGRFVCN
jgi:hypothetical protein